MADTNGAPSGDTCPWSRRPGTLPIEATRRPTALRARSRLPRREKRREAAKARRRQNRQVLCAVPCSNARPPNARVMLGMELRYCAADGQLQRAIGSPAKARTTVWIARSPSATGVDLTMGVFSTLRLGWRRGAVGDNHKDSRRWAPPKSTRYTACPPMTECVPCLNAVEWLADSAPSPAPRGADGILRVSPAPVERRSSSESFHRSRHTLRPLWSCSAHCRHRESRPADDC